MVRMIFFVCKFCISGSRTVIKQTNLKSTDAYSDNSPLTYTLAREPKIGTVYVETDGTQLPVSTKGLVNTFTQTDIDQGNSQLDGCVMEIKFTKTTCLKSGAFCSNTKIKIKTVGCHCKLAATFVVFTPTYFCQIVTKASSLLNILESIPETSQYSNNVEKVSYLKTH